MCGASIARFHLPTEEHRERQQVLKKTGQKSLLHYSESPPPVNVLLLLAKSIKTQLEELEIKESYMTGFCEVLAQDYTVGKGELIA